jgi:hypothetical protein
VLDLRPNVEGVMMTEKRIGAAGPVNSPPGKGMEAPVAAPFQKGQSAANLLGALATKPIAEVGGGGSAGSSSAAEGASSKKS